MVAEDDDDASKTEDPSARKIEKAKEEGDAAISQEFKSFIMLLGMLFVVWMILPLCAKWYYSLTLKFIENPDSIPMDYKHVQLLFSHVAKGLFKILAIPFGIFMILGIIASLSQTGFIYAPKKLSPKWDKLNLFANLPKLITAQKVMDSIKSIVKIVVIGWLAYTVVKPYITNVKMLPTMDTIDILSLVHKIVMLLIFTVVLAILIIAAADYAWQKYSHLKKLRMTKQEVKDEYKQTEGDPLVKSKIRQTRMERARTRMMSNVPNADVIIVNPTHYAIALEYKMDTMDAPKVVAKGVDHLALRIREVGEENDVPIIENPPLARALFASVEIDQVIPEEHFKAVAEVIGYVMQLKQ